jgi:CrcB protein
MAGRLEPYLLIAAGGFAGACARYAINEVMPGTLGILLINVVGCYLLGFLMYESIFVGAFSPQTRLVYGSGFIGAFTTFSTFSYQTFVSSPMPAMLNVLLSLALGLLAVFLGRITAIKGRSLWKQ